MAKGSKKAGKGTAARGEKGGGKAERRASLDRRRAAEQEPPEPPAQPGRPAGQRLYDVPFSSSEPRLVHREVGLHNLVARAGHNAAYTIDVTLLDAPDLRLTRSGVLLAHRVLDERGEWFLTAPDWQPLLPKDHVEPMGDADLPEDLAGLIRPLRRRATLGPVAALNCDRREFALRDDAGSTLALLRDDKVTVRRGGLTTARYREVMITPVGRGLNAEQRASVDRAFRLVGANRVPRFPRLVTRLGAPATGASDIPAGEPLDATLPLRRFVAAVVGNRLREVVRADLALRGGDEDALARLRSAAATLRDELDGLAPALEADWAEDLHDDLGWLVASATGGEALRSERYLSALERLVSAARSPHLVVDASGPAGTVLAGLLAREVRALRDAADRLRVDAPDAAWREVREAFDRVGGLAGSVAVVLPEESQATLALLRRPARPLASVHLGDGVGKSTQVALLARRLEVAGREVVTTFEPGGTRLGAVLRAELLHGDDVGARTEALLYAADKAEHLHQVVLPALTRGAVVVCDRYVDSMVAYQGAGRVLDADEVERVARWATDDLRPDLTVLLDLDPQEGLGTLTEPDRLESAGLDFHVRARASFLALAARDPGRYLVLPARDPREGLAEAVGARVDALLSDLAARVSS